VPSQQEQEKFIFNYRRLSSYHNVLPRTTGTKTLHLNNPVRLSFPAGTIVIAHIIQRSSDYRSIDWLHLRERGKIRWGSACDFHKTTLGGRSKKLFTTTGTPTLHQFRSSVKIAFDHSNMYQFPPLWSSKHLTPPAWLNSDIPILYYTR
jgi:hypothetical protein